MKYEDSAEFAYLQKYLAVDAPNGNGWWDAFCPLHADQKRSAGFNFEEDRWSCRTGCGSGSISDLIDMLEARSAEERVEQAVVGGFVDDSEVISLQEQRSKRRPKGVTKAPPTEEEIDLWRRTLEARTDLLEALVAKRGISPETLSRFEIGYDEGSEAYTIPIRNREGKLRNLRLYHWNRPRTKIWHWGGMEPSEIFPEAILDDSEDILICEGEWDALIAIDRGFNAVSGTTGAWQWMSKWNHKFKDLNVWIAYDRDKAGDDSSEKVARNLEGVARSIRIATLPLPWTEKHGQDVTDFFRDVGSAEQFKTVLRDARVHTAARDGDPMPVSVKESYNPELSGELMAMTVSVVGKGLQTHLVPKDVFFACDIGAGKKCSGCPMADNDGTMKIEVKPSSPSVLQMRDVPTSKRDDVLREVLGAHKCGRMETVVREFQTTELLVVRTSIEEAEDDDHRSRTIINAGEYRTEANQVVRIMGTTHPSPTSQESLFLSWGLSPVESSLDNYKVSAEDIDLMKVFRPSKRQTPLRKIGDVARDLATHVTKIIGRPELHVAMDLVWHSAIGFSFGGETIERGWLELLVVGDARTGKSEVATKLMRYYGFGRMVSCESASIPGLLGAVKPMPGASKTWTLEWGAIPLNDRRLVVLDEAGGLATDQIGQLSSLRSSGVAEIVKAEREQTRARTRQIWLSNPRGNLHGMSSFMYGVHSILPLIGNQEDVARFDFAMTVESGDVPLEDINQRHRTEKRPRYSPEACHALIRWVWSRSPDQVVFESEAEEAVYSASLELGKTYVPEPPLIQGQNVRVKLARLSVAVAARVFSTDRTHQKIVVKKEHVDAAVSFLTYLYEKDSFGYGEVSKRAREEERAAIESMDEVKEYLYSRPGLSRFLISTQGEFRRQQMEEQLNYAREEANLVIQKLSSMNMIRSSSDWDYRVMPHLNTVLRETKGR